MYRFFTVHVPKWSDTSVHVGFLIRVFFIGGDRFSLQSISFDCCIEPLAVLAFLFQILRMRMTCFFLSLIIWSMLHRKEWHLLINSKRTWIICKINVNKFKKFQSAKRKKNYRSTGVSRWNNNSFHLEMYAAAWMLCRLNDETMKTIAIQNGEQRIKQ